MSYNDAETSVQDGRPVALYTFKWGNTVWRYTSADRDITRVELGVEVTYVADAFDDEGVVQGGSSENDFTINCPADTPLARLFYGTPPNETIWLTVRRIHVGETDAPIYTIGTVINVKRTSLSDAKITTKPLSATFKRTGLRLCWTRECPHFLYDQECKVNPEDHRVNAVVSSKTGNTITVSTVGGKDNDYFRGGFVSWPANTEGTLERRMIEDHTGNVIRFFGLTDRLPVGTAVALYPGCTRNPEICDSRFDNIENYGGYQFMPGSSPFGKQLF